MKERQRWQPEEDALLRAYVKQYGAKEWSLISQRMGTPLQRDPKSCLERWKNYLRPGLKKGSLSPDEQSLVVSLQAKYGNKWKKIAAELPGRTAKRLGKWWEVFKDKQLKLHHRRHLPSSDPPDTAALPGPYDHILHTFAEKYVQPTLLAPDPPLPLWMTSTAAAASSSASSATPSPSVSLTLSPSEPEEANRILPAHQIGALVQLCKDLEEGRQIWMQHKKEATWRLNRLEQQLEAEKARKKKEKMEEMEAKIRSLREEEMAYMGRIESDYRDQLKTVQREAESKEAKLLEAWCSAHAKLGKLVEQIGAHGHG